MDLRAWRYCHIPWTKQPIQPSDYWPRRGMCAVCVGPLDPSKVRKDFQRLLKRAEILRRRVYDSQHTFGSLRLAEGTPLTLREPPDGPQLTGDDTPLLRSVDT